jgi:hypothetical protein
MANPQTSAPDTLPAGFFAGAANAPDTLPANFFSQQAAPSTLPADFFSGKQSAAPATPPPNFFSQPAHDPNDRFAVSGQGEARAYTPSVWDKITSLFSSRRTLEPGLNISPMTEAVGNAVPEGALPALSVAKRVLVDPFNKMADAGGKAGREAGRDVVTGYTMLRHPSYLEATLPSPYGPKHSVMSPEKLAEQEHPIAMGVAGGVGSVVGSTISDPRNWPFFASSAARPLLQKLIARGFSAQMGIQTYEGAKELYDNWDKLKPAERAEIGAKTGVGALFLAKGMAEGGVQTHAIEADSPVGKVLADSAPSIRVVDSTAAARDLVEADTKLRPDAQVAAVPSEVSQARTTGPTGNAAFINPTARVVSDGHIPVVSNDEILAHSVANILINSHELQNAGLDLSTIKTDRDIDAALQIASDHIESNLPPRAYATIGFEMQKQLAAETGQTVDQLLSHPNGIAMNAENLLAARMILKESYNHVLELTRAAAASASSADRDAAMTALSQHQAIQERVAGVRAEAGRALVSFRIGNNELPATKIQNAFAKLPKNIQDQAIDFVSRLDPTSPHSVRALNEMVARITPHTTMEKLFEYYRSSLLSSPHTIIVKTASEAAMVAMETMKKAIAGGVAKFKDSPDRFAAESWYYAKGMAQALAEHSKAILTGEFQLEGSPGFERAGQQAIKGRFGQFVRSPGEAMSRLTNLVYAGNYFGELNSLAARQAISEALTGDAFHARQEYLAHHPTDAMSEAAHDLAMHNTFQNGLGQFAEKIGQVIATKPTAKWLPESMKSTAPLKWLFPFYRTPINLVKASLTHATPYELLNGITKGDDGYTIQTDAMARGLLGSSIAASLAALAISGHLTGGGPVDYKKEETLRATGFQPYSLKIGDRYYSYHRFEPVGLAAGLVADAVHGMKNGDSEVVAQSKVDNAVKHIARNLDDMPFLGTLANLLQAVHDPVGGRARSFISREAASLVPAGVANIAETLDLTVRRPQTTGQAIQSRIPGLTGAAPAIIDIRGNQVQRPLNNLGGANPFPFTTAKHDPVVDELSRLGISTPQPPTQIKWKGSQHEPGPTPLTDDERQQFATAEGQELYKRVGRLLQSGAWQKRTDDQKRKALVELHHMIDESRPARLTRMRRQSQAELARGGL